MLSSSPLYYRLFITKENKVTIVCMQDFDEYDYDQSRFIRDEDDEPYIFYNEDEAKKVLNDLIKIEMIDPEYLSSKSQREIFFK